MAAGLLAIGAVPLPRRPARRMTERAAIAPLIKQGEHARALEAIDAALRRRPPICGCGRCEGWR